MAWVNNHGRTTYGWSDVPDEELPNDREMKSALVDRLNENLYTQDAEIKVEVEDRVVVLDGEVEAPIVREAAVDDAWDVPGVVDVDDHIAVNDDEA